MYRIKIDGKEKDIDSTGITIENGMVIFFYDEACTKSKFVVAPGKWDSLEVMGDSQPIQIQRPASEKPIEHKMKEVEAKVKEPIISEMNKNLEKRKKCARIED